MISKNIRRMILVLVEHMAKSGLKSMTSFAWLVRLEKHARRCRMMVRLGAMSTQVFASKSLARDGGEGRMGLKASHGWMIASSTMLLRKLAVGSRRPDRRAGI